MQRRGLFMIKISAEDFKRFEKIFRGAYVSTSFRTVFGSPGLLRNNLSYFKYKYSNNFILDTDLTDKTTIFQVQTGTLAYD